MYDGFGYSDEEIALLKEHDEGEELHAFVPLAEGSAVFPQCAECGDDESGIMHNNTWRNVEPLMYDMTDELQWHADNAERF